MKSQKSFMINVILLLVFLAICAIVYQFFIIGCFWFTCAPEREFNVIFFQIPNMYFPHNAAYAPLTLRRGGIMYADEYSQGINWGVGKGYFIIMKFISNSKASHIYQKEKELRFFNEELINPEDFSDVLSFQSSIADEYFVDCGIDLNNETCVFGARYKEFYFFYESTIDNKMSKEKFLNIIRYIENRAMEALYPR